MIKVNLKQLMPLSKHRAAVFLVHWVSFHWVSFATERLTEKTVVEKDFISQILKLFHNDETLQMVGFCGNLEIVSP